MVRLIQTFLLDTIENLYIILLLYVNITPLNLYRLTITRSLYLHILSLFFSVLKLLKHKLHVFGLQFSILQVLLLLETLESVLFRFKVAFENKVQCI